MCESVDTSTEHDVRTPYMRYVTVLEVGGVHTVVVTDYENRCVKSLYTKNNRQYQSRLQLNDSPWGITQLGDNEVMVAVQDANQIVRVEVNPDLVYVSHINTGKRYTCLVVMTPSRLVAGGYDTVDILNMQGEVLKSIGTHNNMELFRFSDFMCVSNTGHILVSDWGKYTVTCLTSEGEVVRIYSAAGRGALSFPKGISTTGEGDVLVADSGLKKVIQLSESGEYVRDVLTSQDGLQYPEGICVDKHGTLFICDSDKLLKFVLINK